MIVNSIESAPLVGLHLPGSYAQDSSGSFVDDRLENWGRADIIGGLRDAGAEVVVTRGQAAFTKAHVWGGIVTAVQDGIYLEMATRPKVSVAVLRNVAGVIGGGVPELNHPDVRALASDKLATNQFLKKQGLAKPFAPWSPGEELSDAFDLITGDEVVLKPVRGKRGQGVVLGTKAEIAAHVSSTPLEGAFIIEQRLRTKPLENIRGRDKAEQEKIRTARAAELPSELRAYTFGFEGDEQQTHFVLRVARPGANKLGDDGWVYIDQDSVPEEIHNSVRKLDLAVQQQTGVRETHLGVDWTALDSGLYVPMEINAGEPQLVYMKDDQSTAKTHVNLVVKQLMRAARRGV